MHEAKWAIALFSAALAAVLPAQSLLKDVEPGPPDLSADSEPYSFVEFGQHAYFTQREEPGGRAVFDPASIERVHRHLGLPHSARERAPPRGVAVGLPS